MAVIPQVKAGSGHCVNVALEFASNVHADEETRGMETDVQKDRTALQGTIKSRNDAQDAVTTATGALNAAKNKTKREFRTGMKKVAAELDSERSKGEKDPLYLRLLDKKTVGAYIPADSEDRKTELEKFKERVADAETPAPIRKLLQAAIKAIAEEQAARKAVAAAQAKLDKARAKEHAQLLKTIGEVRALVKAVEGKFSEDPARAREVLGWSDPVRKSPEQKIAEQLKAARAVIALAEEAARRAEAAAKQIAELEAQLAELKAAEGKKKPKRGAGGGAGSGGGPRAMPVTEE
jgi:hypothetical protein